MKKVLTFVLVGGMLALAACSQKPKTEEATDSTKVDSAMTAPAADSAATDTTAAADTTKK
ncbi:MAG: hypothetical protein U0Y10_27075 [Spirosomataceae bacterium]